MAERSESGVDLDQAAAERMLKTGAKLQWQHVQDYDRQPAGSQFGSQTSHLKYVGMGWAVIVGASVAKSLLDPAKRHLLISHRLIHARIVAQWATVGALIAAGAGEKMVSMYGGEATPPGVSGDRAVPLYREGAPKREDWTRL